MKFNLRLLGFLVVFSVCFSSYAQMDDYIPAISLSKIAHINQTDSYVTFPTDIGNIERLLFEANVNPSFIIREHIDSKLMLELSPQIRIRMFLEESLPVRTPSYIPKLTLYNLFHQEEGTNTLTGFFRIAHHSNGQEDAFLKEDGTINLRSGNFSTNYLELGLLESSFANKLDVVKVFQSSLEFHPKALINSDLIGTYSRLRLNNSFTAFKVPNQKSSHPPHYSLKIESTLMLDNFNNLKALDYKRLNLGVTYFFHPKFLEEVGLFLQFYHGYDYYNIYYQHRLTVLRFGIMTELLKL